MQVTFKRSSLARLRTPLLCLPLYEGESVKTRHLAELDAACAGMLMAVLRTGDFTGKQGTQVTLYNPESGGPRRILLQGVGKPEQLDLERVRQTASRAVKRAGELQVSDLAILFPTPSRFEAAALAQALTEGCVLGDYRYDKYVTLRNGAPKSVQSVTLVAPGGGGPELARAGVERGLALGDVVCQVRDMVNAPGNELTPTEMANRAAEAAKAWGMKYEVLERVDLQKLGMGGLLAVSQGSDQPPRFIVLEYDGTPEEGVREAPYVFAGKGLTFDAGGICIKPASKMDEMKGDMAGGAAVLGVVQAAARLRLPVHVVALVPATENLLGGSAYRPGDILRMMNGKTVFVDNTDAEGRIVLADALHYAQRYRPQAVIDLATLTGAALVALGQVATAVLGNDETLVGKLVSAGDRCFERLWQLPLWEEFEELIKSPIADVKNTGGKHGGTITAAAFLRHFVGTVPWAHLDIAGTAYLDKPEGYRPQGGTGVGVRLLIEYLEAEIASRDGMRRESSDGAAKARPSRARAAARNGAKARHAAEPATTAETGGMKRRAAKRRGSAARHGSRRR